MDLNFYSGLPDGCAQNVDSEFLGNQTYGGYTEGNKVTQTHFFGETSKGGKLTWINVSASNLSFNANHVFQFSEGSDSYLTIGGGAHHFLSAEVTES